MPPPPELAPTNQAATPVAMSSSRKIGVETTLPMKNAIDRPTPATDSRMGLAVSSSLAEMSTTLGRAGAWICVCTGVCPRTVWKRFQAIRHTPTRYRVPPVRRRM